MSFTSGNVTELFVVNNKSLGTSLSFTITWESVSYPLASAFTSYVPFLNDIEYEFPVIAAEYSYLSSILTNVSEVTESPSFNPIKSPDTV